MAKKSNFGIQFEGFEELMEKYDKLGGDLKEVASDCLKAAHDIVTPKLHADMKRHHRTGKTEDAIIDKPTVHWQGTVGATGIGFEFPEGLTSIFLMYGTPRMKKDTKLYNDIYGSAVKKKIAAVQAEILERAISKRLGG